MDGFENVLERLRANWARRVTPLLGPLVDAWDGLSNDQRAVVAREAPKLAASLNEIRTEVERQ